MSTAVIGSAPVAPIQAEPNLRGEQVTQLIFGRVADVIAAQGDWRRVRVRLDRYEGWIHVGYCRELETSGADAWEREATGWSEGAVGEVRDKLVRIPPAGRVQIDAAGGMIFPGGRRGKLLSGRVTPAETMAKESRAMPVDKWITRFYGGAPYQWGGLTPWGIDCSGLVQMAFAARGVPMPRDSFLQSEFGDPVTPETARSGDLLFFSENGRSVTHVAIVGPNETLIHSTVSAGGVLQEPWGPDSRAAFLRDIVVGGRRPPRGEGPAL